VSLPADEVTRNDARPRWPGRRVLVAGGAVSIVGALAVGVLGSSGAGGLAAAFVGGALTCAVAGLTVLISAVRDEFRRTRSSRRDVAIGMGLLLLAPVMLVLAAGAAGGA
jgi:hypothetical protein